MTTRKGMDYSFRVSLPASIGLVIPNFNGERFLPATLESVVSQNYPRLRCILMDGGSRDSSLTIAREYQRKYRGIEIYSERDEGQADAIQKGFDRLDTELVGWLNSDDALLPGTLHRIAQARELHPDAALFYGNLELCDEFGRLFSVLRARDLDYDTLRTGRGVIAQPGSFYSRELLKQAGGVRREFWGLMDLDLWLRLLQRGEAVRLRDRVAQFRVHASAKSSELPVQYYREALRITWRYNAGQRLRALTPRVLGIPLHFARWLNGTYLRSRPRLVEPTTPLRIELPAVLLPSSVAEVLQNEPLFASANSPGNPGAEPAVRFVDVETVLHSQRGFRTGREFRSPVVAVTTTLSERQASELVALRAPLAFVLAGSAAAQCLIAQGFPAFRVGDRAHAPDWQRGLEVALAATPR
ncbi:MAG TPA: glycosyltransferase family 2 protein [Polyangiaceae bacterium]|nr:glycosyltransferase family 2 protein [Polyangiaceae bacterium]